MKILVSVLILFKAVLNCNGFTEQQLIEKASQFTTNEVISCKPYTNNTYICHTVYKDIPAFAGWLFLTQTNNKFALLKIVAGTPHHTAKVCIYKLGTKWPEYEWFVQEPQVYEDDVVSTNSVYAYGRLHQSFKSKHVRVEFDGTNEMRFNTGMVMRVNQPYK